MKVNWKYAVGEILIVIIGISLAFSLNTWKESGNSEKLKRKYMNYLISDIEAEIEQLEKNNHEIEEKIEEKIKQIRIIKPFLGNSAIKRDTIIQNFFSLAILVNFNPENTTYQTLVNFGDMKLIEDFELRRHIEAHYSFHETVLKDYERIEKIHEKYLADFFIHQIDYDKVFKGDASFLDKPPIKNIVLSIEGAYGMVFKANNKCLESNRKLVEHLRVKVE